MSQPQSVEEIMQRLRAQIRATRVDAPPDSTAARAESQDSSQILERVRQQLNDKKQAIQAPGSPEGAFTGREAWTGVSLNLHDIAPLRGDVEEALEGHRKVGQVNPRPPGPVSALIQFAKKGMRRVLTWYTRPIHEFQGAVIRALQQTTAVLQNHSDSLRTLADRWEHQNAATAEQITALTSAQQAAIETQKKALADQYAAFQRALDQRLDQRLDERLDQRLDQRLGQRLDPLEQRLDQRLDQRLEQRLEQRLDHSLSVYSQRIASLTDELETLRAELRRTREQVRDSAMQQRLRDRDLRRFVHGMETGQYPQSESAPPEPAIPPMFPSAIQREKEFDYFAFEDRYRGDESDIRERQKEYLEYFRGRENVLDIGCGRGEFLELLRDNNICARGVELGTDPYLLCKEKGLDVVQQDLFAYLELIPDESLGGLFSAQVIEHLTASDQLCYVTLAHQKTTPGSPVIFETINPQCVYALVRNFFLDPTHIRPVHPETLKFAMESATFKNVEIRFSGPVADRQIPALHVDGGNSAELEKFNRATAELNELVYGHQDYAAIGWK